MIINFLGDSITEGVGASSFEKKYVELVKSKLNIEVRNYGISGTRIARQSEPSMYCLNFDLDFQLRFNSMGKADYLFIFGGTNDWGHGDALIGNIDDTNPYTFCGGMNNLVKMVLNSSFKDKVCFLLPLHRFDNEDNLYGDSNRKFPTLPLSGYVDIMKTILDKNNIKYINLYEVGPKDNATYFADGVHPNDLGHEYLSNIVINYLKENKII